MRPAAEVFVGFFIGRDESGAGAAFDRHVANRHPVFHRQGTDHVARVFDAVSHAARSADLADEIQNDVFGCDAGFQAAIDAQLKRFRFRLQQRLRGEHVLDLARADAEGQRAERAVGRGVAVAADDGHAWLRVSLLGADNVDDALPRVMDVVKLDAELATVIPQGFDLLLRDEINNRQAAIGRRHVVIDRRKRPLWPANRAAGEAQALEGLWACDFVHQVQVDVENRLPAWLVVDDVLVPNLFEKCARFLGHEGLPGG